MMVILARRWSGGSRSFRVLIVVCVALALTAPAAGQTAPVVFDVTSVKPNASGRPFGTMGFGPGGFTATNVTVAELIRNAYSLQPAQLIGGPEWMATQRFDVSAKTAPGAAASPQMLQALLAERFSLRVHPDTRDLPLFALILARADRQLGPQLRRSDVDCVAVAANPAAASAATTGGREACDAFTGPAPRMHAAGVTMAQLAASLARHVRETVVERTGLTGRYDLEMQWTPATLPPRPAGSADPLRLNGFIVDPDGPSIFTALQEQLGLKLEPGKGAVTVVVVDAVSPPAAD